MTLLSTLRPADVRTATQYVNDSFDADTVGSVPVNWVVESGTNWSVAQWPIVPDLLTGRVLAGDGNNVSDNYIRRTWTRITGGEVRIAWRVRTPNSTSSRGGLLQVYDTTGAYLVQLGPLGGVWSYGNSSGVGGGAGSWVGATVYIVELIIDMDRKKFRFIVNGTSFDNAGAWWDVTTGATGLDRLKISSFSPNLETFYIDNVQVGTLVPASLPPTGTGTITTSGTFGGQTMGVDRFAQIKVGYSNADSLISFIKVERSTNNSTWADISAQVGVTQTSAGNWVITDRRPQYGPQATTYGGSVYYRLSGSNSGGSTPTSSGGPITTDVNVSSFETSRFAKLSGIMAGAAMPSSVNGEPYSILWMGAMAYAYAKTATAQYLTDTSNEFTYLQGLTVTPPGIWQMPDYNTVFYRDHHWRTILWTAVVSRVLRRAGATTLANSMIAQADTWASNFYNNLAAGNPFSTITRSGFDANNDSTTNNQRVWTASTVYAAGDIVTPTARNGRTYRVTVGGNSGATQPTWPTVNGGSVTVNSVTYVETTVTGAVTFATYDTTSPYAGVVGDDEVDLNQVLEEAAACALLTSDAASAFSSAGTLRTKALQHITDSTTLTTAYATSTGAVPIGDTFPAVNGPEGYDTLYAGYALECAAVAYKYQPGSCNQWLDEWITRGLNWLNSAYGTEPNVGGIHYSGTTNTYASEIAEREYPMTVMGVTFPLRKLKYTAAVNDPVNDTHGDYNQFGTINAYPDALQARIFADDVFLYLLTGQTLTLTVTGTSAQTPAKVVQVNATRTAAGTEAAGIVRQPQPRRTATSANTTTVARSTSVIRAATSPNLAVVVKRPARGLTATSSQQAAVTAVKSKLLTLAATSPQTATLARSVTVIRTGASANATGVIRAVTTTRTASSANAATASAIRARLLTLTATGTATATLTKQARATKAAASSQQATLATVTGFARVLNATSPQATSLRRVVTWAARVATSAQVGSVTTIKAKLASFTAISAQTGLLTRQPRVTRTGSSPQTVTRTGVVAHAVTAASPNTGQVVKRPARTLTATSTQAATISTLKLRSATLTATSGQAASIARRVTAVRVAVSGQVGSRAIVLPPRTWTATSPNLADAVVTYVPVLTNVIGLTEGSDTVTGGIDTADGALLVEA